MEVGILGPLRVVAEDGRVLDIGGSRRRSLLALLVLDTNRAVAAEVLIDRLWDGAAPPTATGTLQSHISHLRRVLGPDRIETVGPSYRLRLDPGELDADAFEADLAAARDLRAGGDPAATVDALARALARWRGPALAELAGSPWAVAEAARLDELRLVATESLLEARLDLGRHAEVVADTEAAIALHPLRERLWGHLITALYRDGRQADALRAYQRLRQVLADELGIDPSPELRALEAAILAQDPLIDAPPAPIAADATTLLPSGVVTFLLTDVVGSTRLWETAPSAMALALARHDALIRGAVEAHGGTFLKARGEGDSTFSAFRRATDAVAAARSAALSLQAEPFPVDAPIVVRAALHTGEAVERDGDYYGRAVNRAARLRSAAEPGQILLSRATADLVVDHLPADVRLENLGELSLRDLDRAETAFALVTEAAVEPPTAPDAVDAVPFPHRLAPSAPARFVGRPAEQAALDRRWKAALTAEPGIVLVAGEPGIGKTSLVAETAKKAYAAGAIVLYGRCDPDVGVPYLPWVEAIEHLARHGDVRQLEAAGPRALADLARLVPPLADRVPGLAPAAPGDPDGDRYRLFAAVTSALAVIARDQPLVLVVDDLHWADKPTLVLLRHVVTTVTGKVLVIGTYRPSDLTADHPLSDLLAALRRETNVERIALAGLGDDEVIDLVEALAGQPISGPELGLVHAVRRETDGNPFFTIELLQHLVETGVVTRDEAGRWVVDGEPHDVGLPESIREVVSRRVAHLGDVVERVLETASVIGRTFSVDVLEAVVDEAGGDVLDALERAEAASLVTTVDVGEFAFAHALVSHALYDGLNATRRARLHARIAEEMESLGLADRKVNELARHWAAAAGPRELDKAIGYAEAAGRQALRALAPDEAVRWYAQALELADEKPEVDERRRCAILIGLGRAQRQAGAPYRETLLEAARLADRFGDVDQLARAALANNRGMFSMTGDLDVERVGVLETALERLPTGDSATRARVLATLAAELAFDVDGRRRRELSDEAVAIARRLGDPVVLVHVLVLRYSAIWSADMLDERVANMAEAREAAAAAGNPTAMAWVDGFSHIAALEAGDIDDADRFLERYAEAAERLGMPHMRGLASGYRASQAIRAGDVDAAARLADLAREYNEAIEQDDFGIVPGPFTELCWHQHRLDDLRRMLDTEVGIIADTDVHRARIACCEGKPAEANRVLDEAMQEGFVDRRDAFGWLQRTALAGEVAALVGSRRHAEVLYDALLPYRDRVGSTGANIFTVVPLSLALLAVTLERDAEADQLFADAIALVERIGYVFHTARAQAAWGRLLIARPNDGDVRRGEILLRTALDTAKRFGCPGVVRDAADALASLAK